MIFIFFFRLLVVPHSIAIHFIMFTGACTEDEDCKNATIETGNDNCASLRHYPHEEPLRTSLGFSEENAATKESFEDETQSGNFQHSIIQLVPVISPLSGSVKVIYAATKESFEDETQSGNFQHSIIQLVPVISPSSGSVKVILLILERIILIRNFNQA